jgi:MoaA/NifB/PqqE/SkfB family radical SAM enzyme
VEVLEGGSRYKCSERKVAVTINTTVMAENVDEIESIVRLKN